MAAACRLGEPYRITYKTVGRTFIRTDPHRIAVQLPVLYHAFKPLIGSSRDPYRISNINNGLVHT